MDHDAMNTHVTKLRTFRDDFLALSGLSLEQFHEMADKRRAGEPLGNLAPARLEASGEVRTGGEVSSSQFQDLADHVKEVSETVASLQQSVEQLEAVKLTMAGSADSLSWLLANRTALEGLLAGSAAAACAINEEQSSDGAAKTEAAPASPIESAGGPASA